MLLDLVSVEGETLLRAIETAKNDISSHGLRLTEANNLEDPPLAVCDDIIFFEHNFFTFFL